MTKRKLIDLIKDYMIENDIGFLNVTASTDILRLKENISMNFYEETEDEIDENGYQSNFTC